MILPRVSATDFHDVAEKRYADPVASGKTISWEEMRSNPAMVPNPLARCSIENLKDVTIECGAALS